MTDEAEYRAELQHQVAVCQLVARLVRARLPLSRELSAAASEAEQPIAALAEDVQQRIAAGQSLSRALAADPSPQSRVLAACIEAGELSDQLGEALESWFEMHLANAKAERNLRVALVYPVALVVIALLSFGLAIWHLIPHYQMSFALFQQELPNWLQGVVWFREHFAMTLTLVTLAAFAPPLGWFWSRRGLAGDGLPREPARRLRQQALATQIARLLLMAHVPLKNAAPLAVQVAGGGPTECEQAFLRLQAQQVASPLPAEGSLVLAALQTGTIKPAEASEHLQRLAEHYSEAAEITAGRHARWIPMLVALTVGCLTITVYVGLIYLPWIWLMKKIVDPQVS